MVCAGLVCVGECNGSCRSKPGLGMLGTVTLWKLFGVVAMCGAEGLGGKSFRLCLPTVFWDPFKSAAVMG